MNSCNISIIILISLFANNKYIFTRWWLVNSKKFLFFLCNMFISLLCRFIFLLVRTHRGGPKYNGPLIAPSRGMANKNDKLLIPNVKCWLWFLSLFFPLTAYMFHIFQHSSTTSVWSDTRPQALSWSQPVMHSKPGSNYIFKSAKFPVNCPDCKLPFSFSL